MKNKLLKRSNGGFSLVELIVVIAIMAILVGVAVPVYSSYIEKSQKGADEQLADEIKHAIEIGLIAGKPDGFKGGVVVKLSATGATVTNGSADDIAFVEGILEQTFGSSWATELKLKYDGWKSGTAQTVMVNYAGSSFDGNEEALLGQIQNLTASLSGVIATNPTVVGSSFGGYLEGMEIDKTDSIKAGNAAVLYVAGNTSSLLGSQENTDKFVNAWVSGDYGPILGEIGVSGQAAATYAKTEALFQYLATNATGEKAKQEATNALNTFHTIDFTGSADIQADVLPRIERGMENAFGCMSEEELETLANTYWYSEDAAGQTQEEKDALAYLAAMSAVMDADDLVKDSLGENDCYTNSSFLESVNAYITVGSVGISNGEMAVVINCEPDGSTKVLVYPTFIQ